MPSLAELIHTKPGLAKGAVSAVIATAPAKATDDLTVVIPSFDGGRVEWGPCPWVPANALPEDGDPCLVIFDENEAPWVAVLTAGTTPLVTTLPASPVNGQEVVLTDSLTAPTYRWHLRYSPQATSAFKWDYIGGTTLTVDNSGPGQQINCTPASTGVALTMIPTLVLPRAGDYTVKWGGRLTNDAFTSSFALDLCLYRGAGTPDNIYSAATLRITGAGQGAQVAMSYILANVPAGAVCGLSLRSSVAQLNSVRYVWFEVAPRRVS
jgi:hypothetical protein